MSISVLVQAQAGIIVLYAMSSLFTQSCVFTLLCMFSLPRLKKSVLIKVSVFMFFYELFF